MVNGKIKLLGVDAAFANFGMASVSYDLLTGAIEVQKLHLIKTDKQTGKTVRKNSDDLRRAREINRAFTEIAAQHNLVLAEVPAGAQNANAAWALAIVVGILACSERPMVEVSPTEVKLASVGKKTATKQEMIEWAVGKHPEAEWLRRTVKGEVVLMNDNEHLADALAVIYAGTKTEQFRGMTEMYKTMASLTAGSGYA